MTLFFSSEVGGLRDDPRLARCGRCGLHKGCQSPRMLATGEGRRRVLIVAEAPGKEEDKQHTQLIGPAGQTLRKCLSKIDVDLDRDCWKTNAVICFPGRNPTKEEVLACRSNLLKTVRELEPETIVLMGGAAVQSLIGWLWREDAGKVSRWVGWRIPSQRLNAWVCPTFHPSYVMRTERAGQGEEQARVISILFRRHLERAFELRGRPWSKPPEFERQVKVLLSGREVAEAVDLLIRRSEVLVAFDFETNMLKPDSSEAEVVSCAMSNGEETIAYPMTGEARETTVAFLRSPVPKVAHNMKFDDRWSRRVLGTPVRNWLWCSMQAAHVLDNRRGICGLKFQAAYPTSVVEHVGGLHRAPSPVPHRRPQDAAAPAVFELRVVGHLRHRGAKERHRRLPRPARHRVGDRLLAVRHRAGNDLGLGRIWLQHVRFEVEGH